MLILCVRGAVGQGERCS